MEYRRKKCFWQKLFIIVALLFVPCFIALKNTNLAFADIQNYRIVDPEVNDQRTLSVGSTQYDNVTRTDQTLPLTIAGGRNDTSVFIYGYYFRSYFPSNLNWANYTTINFIVDLRGQGNWWYIQPRYDNPTINKLYDFNPVVINTDGTYNTGTCNTSFTSDNSTIYHAVYDCYVITDKTPNSIGFRVGDLNGINNNTNPFAATGQTFSQNPLYFGGLVVTINSTTNKTDLYLEQQINQNSTIIEQNQEMIDRENEAVDNIDNQSASDIPNSESSQTTSIIGTISSFVSAIGTVQTGSCQMTLPFPSFLGGDTTVNPCTGKDKAPTIVTIGSSMFLIGIFIPFAFVVLKMIYNEIRSFTNG